MQLDEIKELIKKSDSTEIVFTDLNGRVRRLPVNPKNIQAIVRDGIGFDGSSVAGIATVDKSDRMLVPVLDSLKKISFRDKRTSLFVGTIHNEQGQRARTDPRYVLEKAVSEAYDEFGFQFLASPEYEFFLFKNDSYTKDLNTDNAGYCDADPRDRGENVRNHIIDILTDCDIPFEKAHHEVSPSQHEINFECSSPIVASDRTLLFNYVSHMVASEHGFHASFMPKPFDGQNRNALHIHLSMQDKNGKNIFYDKENEFGISLLARRFIAGILKYARQTSIIMASTFNSYKAYVIEKEAPVVVGWGPRNRTSMVRIPYATSPDGTRLELRSPDPAGNIYLQMAALIKMGLQGVRENLECNSPDAGKAYFQSLQKKIWDDRFLPKSMFEALVEAERSTFLKEMLGQRLYDNLMNLKTNEWEEHRTHVTQREFERYLPI
ncbi:glutamine synthetase family protein [Desulfonatronovibrio hydrogenovorans]|uniref:glutamine synthetase family protein n=1 Tax=Desulfonatronovibrio hydrogenovorans TaxID=53245 RepID=UPI00048F636C|nr:glutamine synthetase family protein [Desulfonatronovibrio hydrogenovorans]